MYYKYLKDSVPNIMESECDWLIEPFVELIKCLQNKCQFKKLNKNVLNHKLNLQSHNINSVIDKENENFDDNNFQNNNFNGE